jgi:Xaa-Pro aminopeptidase
LLTANIELRRILEEEVAGLPLEAVEYRWYSQDGANEIITQLCDTSRAVSDLGLGGLPSAGAGLARLRYTMIPPEIDRYRALCRDASEAVEKACYAARPGETELDVAARVAFECWRRDVLPLVNLVATDERIALYRHPLPTFNRLGRTLLVALTGRRHGLHASLTRMVSFGRPDTELASRHEAVTRVDASEILASKPGVTLGEVVRQGIEQYSEEGFPQEWQLHHQGGLTGYAGREIFATPPSEYRIGSSQALAWNPSITRVKSEDTVLVTEGGHEVLTRPGRWPERKVRLESGSVTRPSILVRDAT